MSGKNGFTSSWRKPETRIYHYNIELENAPVTSYLEANAAIRGRAISVGRTCMTYDAQKWIHGQQYDTTMVQERKTRAESLNREGSYLASQSAYFTRASREASLIRNSALPLRGKAKHLKYLILFQTF